MASTSSIFRRGASSQDEAILVTGPGCDSRRTSLADESEDNNTGVTGKTSVATTATVRVTHDRQQQQQQRNPILQFLDSVINPSSPDETELQEMEDRKNTVNILSPSPNQRQEVVGGYDVCREYSYSTDEDDQVGGTRTGRNEKNYKRRGVNKLFPQDQARHSYLIHSDSFEEETSEEAVLPIHLLGKTYHPINDYAFRRDDESSLFWFTYRADFPEIKPYGIHSDAGWGCMLRSAQMMLAQGLRMHFRSRDWRPSPSLARRRQDPFLRSLLTWFADFPSKSDCVYSLHNMVASGLNYDKLPGEWYGPGTACYVLRDLVELHDRQIKSTQKRQQQPQQQQQLGDDNRKLFRVHVASQGTVYRDEIRRLMTRTSQARFDEEKRKKEAQGSSAAHPLDMAWEEELIESVGEIEWDTSLLILIPLRLGLKSFNAEYVQVVAHTFSLPQSVGVLGGRPRGARWFYGAVADGSKIYGLDPHTVQNSPSRRMARVNGRDSSVVDLSDEYLRSVHTSYMEVFSLLRMDPSIALGFYCRTEHDLENLLTSIENWKKEHPDDPELFSIADTSPDYASSLSFAMKDMMLSGTVASLVDEDAVDDLSEEDEYVML